MTDRNTGREAGGVRGLGTAAPVAATLVVVACTLLLRFQATAAAPDPAVFMKTAEQRRPFVALLVGQAADCRDAMAHMGALNSPELRRVFRTAGLVLGGRGEVEKARVALEERFGGVEVRRATRRHLAALRALGVRATPALLVLDPEGAVVLNAPVPRDRKAAERLERMLSLLAGAGISTPEVADVAS